MVRFDGDGGYSTSGCDDTEGRVEFATDTIDGEQLVSTAIGCPEETQELDDVVARLLNGPTRWTHQGDNLRLDGDTDTGLFRPRTPLWPDQTLNTVLEQAAATGPQYHVGWRPSLGGTALVFQGRERPGRPWVSIGTGTTAADKDWIVQYPSFAVLADRLVIFGVAADGATRVTHELTDGRIVELDIVATDSSTRVYAGVVTPVSVGTVVQQNDQGTEVARSMPVPR